MRAPVSTGTLRHRVDIEAPVRAGDGGGGSIVTWTHVAQVWAAIVPRGGGETVSADRVAGSATHDVWMRYRAGVTPEMRLRWGVREFDIRSVTGVDERRRWLRLLVEERDL